MAETDRKSWNGSGLCICIFGRLFSFFLLSHTNTPLVLRRYLFMHGPLWVIPHLLFHVHFYGSVRFFSILLTYHSGGLGDDGAWMDMDMDMDTDMKQSAYQNERI